MQAPWHNNVVCIVIENWPISTVSGPIMQRMPDISEGIYIYILLVEEENYKALVPMLQRGNKDLINLQFAIKFTPARYNLQCAYPLSLSRLELDIQALAPPNRFPGWRAWSGRWPTRL